MYHAQRYYLNVCGCWLELNSEDDPKFQEHWKNLDELRKIVGPKFDDYVEAIRAMKCFK